ncbi:HNH endonuclease [Streptomyces sp. GSL17-111]|uniref:HNH endonuclease n=1 Tax=Streptomyces sp. GSL17-111 TaxID=3121596 RepID=UPI0030F40DD4
MRHGHPLNSARRRVRKEQLARRHGQRCAYCRRSFTDLSEATLDHVAPLALWRSWSVTSLMLACVDCNHRKADRLPLSIALLLCASASRPPVTEVVTRMSSGTTTPAAVEPTPPRLTGATTKALTSVTTRVTPGVTPRLTLGVWRLLAQLAHANQPVFTAVQSANSGDGQSPSHLHESNRHGGRTRLPSARLVCLRTPRYRRSCAGPTGEAVSA